MIFGINGEYSSRREQIIDQAALLFYEKGYHNASVQELADRLGINKATLYYHVESKDDLLCEIHDRFIDNVLSHAQAIPESAPPRDKLRAILQDILRVVHDYRAHVSVFFREYRSLPLDKAAPILAKRDQYEAVVRRIVEEGMAAGEFRPDLDPGIVTFAVFGMANWAYQWLNPDGRLSHEEIADSFANLLLEGLLTQPRVDVPEAALRDKLPQGLPLPRPQIAL